MTILLVIILLRVFLKNTLRFEKVSGFKLIILPIIIFIIGLQNYVLHHMQLSNIITAIVLLFVAVIVAIYQSKDFQYSHENLDTKIRLGKSYIFGWVALVLFVSMVELVHLHEEITFDHIVSAFIKELIFDIAPYAIFSQSRTAWELLLIGASQIIYYLIIKFKIKSADQH